MSCPDRLMPIDVATVLVAVMVAVAAALWMVPINAWWPLLLLVGLASGATALFVPLAPEPVFGHPPIAPELVSVTPTVQPDPQLDASPAPSRGTTTTSIKGHWSTATTAKLGMDLDQNEDAVAVSGDGLFAVVVDGASSAFASGQWARLLADGFVTERPDLLDEPERDGFLRRCAAKWETETAGGDSWWADEARSRGSFAAFAGIEFRTRSTWLGFAVGGCCLFTATADGNVSSAFPISQPESFNLTPDLISVTNPSESVWQMTRGELNDGEYLLLATDGLAQWLLSDQRNAARILATNGDGWVAFVDEARRSDVMVNDDVAAAWLEKADSSEIALDDVTLPNSRSNRLHQGELR